MKKYFACFCMRFNASLQYRAAAIAGLVTQFAWGGLTLLLYRAFYFTNPSAFPMQMSQLSSYIWLQQAFLALFALWYFDHEIIDSIISGNIAYTLTRPMELYGFWFTNDISTRFAKTLLRFLPIILFASLLPYPYGLQLPKSPMHLGAFLLTSVISACTATAFIMIIYISIFYTMSPLGVRIIAISISDIFSGSIVPIPFLPNGIRQIAEKLPFAALQNVPLRIYIGDYAVREIPAHIALQTFWCLIFIFFGSTLLRTATRRIVVQGG